MSAAKKTVKITQVGSPIGRRKDQRATLVGLDLNKLHRSRALADTPAVRGTIEQVKHLVRVEGSARRLRNLTSQQPPQAEGGGHRDSRHTQATDKPGDHQTR